QSEENTLNCRHLRERLISLPELVIERIGKSPAARQIRRTALGASIPEEHEFVGRAHRQRTKYHGIEKTEDGCVCSNAESERQHCNQDKPGTMGQLPKRVSHVIASIIDISEQRVRACVFWDGRHRRGGVAEFRSKLLGQFLPGLCALYDLLPGFF